MPLLSDAHHHGLIHRDIKPTNIFVCRLGNEYDFVKVLDFGLVKNLDEKETQMTADGATTGTPAFMAPEMAMGSSAVDARTDLYGLGCVAYWLLTGNLVFQEKNAAAMILAHLQKAPIALSKNGAATVPPPLERAIMMCLAKDPAQRPATAESFSLLLDVVNGTVLWTQAEADAWWRTNMAGNVDHAKSSLDRTHRDPDGITTI